MKTKTLKFCPRWTVLKKPYDNRFSSVLMVGRYRFRLVALFMLVFHLDTKHSFSIEHSNF